MKMHYDQWKWKAILTNSKSPSKKDRVNIVGSCKFSPSIPPRAGFWWLIWFNCFWRLLVNFLSLCTALAVDCCSALLELWLDERLLFCTSFSDAPPMQAIALVDFTFLLLSVFCAPEPVCWLFFLSKWSKKYGRYDSFVSPGAVSCPEEKVTCLKSQIRRLVQTSCLGHPLLLIPLHPHPLDPPNGPIAIFHTLSCFEDHWFNRAKIKSEGLLSLK